MATEYLELGSLTVSVSESVMFIANISAIRILIYLLIGTPLFQSVKDPSVLFNLIVTSDVDDANRACRKHFQKFVSWSIYGIKELKNWHDLQKLFFACMSPCL